MSKMAPDVAAELCDEVAEAVHPNFELLNKHGHEMKTMADGMLARLDELGAMLARPCTLFPPPILI